MKDNYPTVDLGLPSGLLWAKCNIGAASEEDTGLYFQWGDKKGYTVDQVGSGDGKKRFSSGFSDYVFYVDNKIIKYNASDGKKVLDLEDDAAHALMGDEWRMPTREDFYELLKNTDFFLVTEEGNEVSGSFTTDGGETGKTGIAFSGADTCIGMRFYKKGDRSTCLFIPVSGVALDSSFQLPNSCHLYSSSINDNNSLPYAWGLSFNKSSCRVSNTIMRCFGCQIRGVRPGKAPV